MSLLPGASSALWEWPKEDARASSGLAVSVLGMAVAIAQGAGGFGVIQSLMIRRYR